jgi:hypothetical protein
VSARPILMSGPLVVETLAGRKTVTRRLVRTPTGPLTDVTYPQYHLREIDEHGLHVHNGQGGGFWAACPFGGPGDRLYVRETWRAWALNGAGDLWRVEYQASAGERGGTRDVYPPSDWTPPLALNGGGWAPSIHMPRWASRLTLEVTGVRVERVQDITEEEARAEGVPTDPHDEYATYRDLFARLWDSLATAGSKWADNPWVWAVSFRRCAS